MKDEYVNMLDALLVDLRRQLLQAYETCNDGFQEERPSRAVSASSSLTQAMSQAMSIASAVNLDGLEGNALAIDGPVSASSSGSQNNKPRIVSPALLSMQSVGSGVDHGDASQVMKSGLDGKSQAETNRVKHRLRLRLGALSASRLVSGKSLHDAVAVLGLTRYTVEDMNVFVNLLADFIHLEFESCSQELESMESSAEVTLVDETEALGTPVWEWPDKATFATGNAPLLTSSRTVSHFGPGESASAARQYNVVPAQALVDVFLAQEGPTHKKIFGSKLIPMYRAMKEILLASETNRLVAELTFVRINDLAAPVERLNLLMYMEPLVAIMIVANGIMIGFQTDPRYEAWSGWIYFESIFAAFLLLEILLRMRFLRCRKYWCGPDRYWNWFDLVLGATGLADLTIQLITRDSSVGGTSLLRFCRLIRLVRIVKVFRIKAMKDLRLMVKGLVAGIRTLLLAFTLLFGVLYVISGFATITIGTSKAAQDLELASFFENIPASMFTAFRCFTGECVNNEGRPIHSILAQLMGWPFIFAYVASYMLVTMGIFNVILAVYVDITMKAAKENDAQTAEQYSRESVRVARTTRELLKKFATAYHVYHAEDGRKGKRNSQDKMNITGLYADVHDHEEIAITKDLFLLIIQDRAVQKLMDDLELPPDRANLFEIIDADGSGTLQITELLQGLLKIRGEINKSDTIAAYLVTKALQETFSEHKEEFHKHKKKVLHSIEALDLKLTMMLKIMAQGQAQVSNEAIAIAASMTPNMSPENVMEVMLSMDTLASGSERHPRFHGERRKDAQVTSQCLPLPIKPLAFDDGEENSPSWTPPEEMRDDNKS